mgnify:CR=1 FL=1
MTWSLATEDELSETVAIRLLEEQGITPDQRLRKGGYGYLRSKVSSWKDLARLRPVLLLTDLDDLVCPVALKADWFGPPPLPPWLCFRIAVREVEAWLLADHMAMKVLYGKKSKMPLAPETLPDPKQHLLQLALKAPRVVKDDIVRCEGSVLKQGVGYNARLCDLVRTTWDPDRAARLAPSLAKARCRIAELAHAVRIEDAHS